MDLQERAASGDTQAQIALARQYEDAGRNDLARGWFARAAQGRDGGAMRALAVNLLTQNPVMTRDGAEMMRTVAGRGDPEASHVCAIIAGQSSDDLQHWSLALKYLAQAARQGSPLAQEELTLLAGAASDRWEEMAAQVEVGPLLTAPASQVKFETPRIGVCHGFASAAECDWLMYRAAPRLKAAELYDPASGGGFRQDSVRNNRDASFNIVQSDLVLLLLQFRIAQMMGVSIAQMEPPMVLHYRPGQHFAPHRDGLDPNSPPLAREIAAKGQRVATVLVYLNDDYQDGETDFPELNWRFKGRKGDALWFWNADAQGRLAANTLHAGIAPRDGEKWLLSQWTRQGIHEEFRQNERQPFRRRTCRQPDLYPQKVAPDFAALLLVRMDASRYRTASFLDDRLLKTAPAVGWVPLAPVAMATRKIKARPLHFIFHAGHVGSTLLSRLLDEVPGVLGLREPLPLRSLAALHDRGGAYFEPLLATFLAFWSRGFADTDRVILKATSSAGRLAPELMTRLPESRAIYLGLAAEPYICTLLAGANARDDLEGLTPERLDRLERLLGERADASAPLSLGEGAALAWLVERFAQMRAAQVLGPRLLVLDFDAFLADPAAALARVLAHFSLPPEETDRLVQSPLWSRYSKAPKHAYSLALRHASLDQARREQGDEIRRGLDFLSRIGARHGEVAALL